MDQKLERDQDTVLEVIGYHQQTKHHFFRYARALGYMDWANQPDPFRRFAGAPIVQLPLTEPGADPSPLYRELFSAGAVPAAPLAFFFFWLAT